MKVLVSGSGGSEHALRDFRGHNTDFVLTPRAA
jgi:phosphoribosylamine-glycine ligase